MGEKQHFLISISFCCCKKICVDLLHYIYINQLELPISAQGSLVDGGERGME